MVATNLVTRAGSRLCPVRLGFRDAIAPILCCGVMGFGQRRTRWFVLRLIGVCWRSGALGDCGGRNDRLGGKDSSGDGKPELLFHGATPELKVVRNDWMKSVADQRVCGMELIDLTRALLGAARPRAMANSMPLAGAGTAGTAEDSWVTLVTTGAN